MFISGQLIVREKTKFGGLLVSACLESLRGFLDEVIIVDNGCSEEVYSMIMCQMKEWPAEYKIFTNGGHSFSELRNFALSKMSSKADWLFQFDSDDIFWPDRLQKVRDEICRRSSVCLFGHFYHLMSTPFYYQGMYKHKHLYPVCSEMLWQGAVHEKLTGVPEKEEDTGLVWTHWGYTRSIVATAIKWIHYQFLENGNADCYKSACLFSERGIGHILDDRRSCCSRYSEKYPPAALKWIMGRFAASRSMTWQDWVTEELDSCFGNMLKHFGEVVYDDKSWVMEEGYAPVIVDYIIEKKLWEEI